MTEEFAIADSAKVETEPFSRSRVAHAKLTEILGAEDMHVNALFLNPGDMVGYHRHERQEEIYVCTHGPGQIFIDGELHNVPVGGVVRVGADVPRQLLNTTESTSHRWVAFGAPPIGPVEDLGAYIRAEGGYDSETA